jgi:hypothetical protein
VNTNETAILETAYSARFSDTSKRAHGRKPISPFACTSKQLLVQLHAQAAGILAEGIVLSIFKHKGLSGIEREEPIRRFLRLHLPGRFHVGQGGVASSTKILQHQHDILVADKDVCFMLLNTLSAQLLAIESLHLVVEVRSRGNELLSVAKGLRAVRDLQPSEGIRDGVIGKTDPAVHTVVIYQGPQQEETVILIRSKGKMDSMARKSSKAALNRLPVGTPQFSIT